MPATVIRVHAAVPDTYQAPYSLSISVNPML